MTNVRPSFSVHNPADLILSDEKHSGYVNLTHDSMRVNNSNLLNLNFREFAHWLFFTKKQPSFVDFIQTVFSVVSCPQMVRINTERIVARMTNMQFRVNQSVLKKVRKSMRPNVSTAHVYLTVSIGLTGSGPFPTPRLRFPYLIPKSVSMDKVDIDWAKRCVKRFSRFIHGFFMFEFSRFRCSFTGDGVFIIPQFQTTSRII